MPISCKCDNCQASYALDDALAGKKVRCKSCSAIILVPAVTRGVVTTAFGATYNAVTFDSSAAANKQTFRPVALDDATDHAAPIAAVDNYQNIDAPPGDNTLVCPICQSKLEKGAVTCAKCRYSFVRAKELKRTGKTSHSTLSAKDRAELSPWWRIWLRWDFMLGGLGLLFAAIALLTGQRGGHGTLVLVTVSVTCSFLLYLAGIFMSLRPVWDEGILTLLAYLFLPFYALYFLITRWSDMKRGFFTLLIGAFVHGITLSVQYDFGISIWRDWSR